MDEPTVTGTDLFEQDPEQSVTELDDGSALVEMPEEVETVESSHYDNLAETLDTFKLNTVAADLLELIEKDKEARKKRDEQYAEGIKRTGLGDEAPGGAMFDGASKAVHPLLAEGCVDFAARTIKELFPPNGPVKTRVFGEATREKLEKAKKKKDYLNFLLTKKMRSYRDEKEMLLTQLPLGGSQYEKFYPDPKRRSYTMEFVPIDKILLPYAATSFYDTPRITHMVDLTRNKFEERVDDGFYKDIRIEREATPEQTAAQTATDKIQGAEADNYNEDGLRVVYEVSCDYDVEEDIGLAPYVIHVDGATEQIVAVYRNWKEDDEDRTKLDWLIENKFIPWRGPYGIGLPHLVGGLAGALTGALRALLDSAHINNSPGAVKLKGGRASGQNITIEQTQVVELEAPPGTQDIRQVIMPLPFNPPSPVLFQLLDWITNQAKGVVATAEERIADASNQMPVGTALALIEQGSQVFSSIHARLHESQRRGLEVICRLIHDYPNEEDLAKFELTAEDFDDNNDIDPVSDPRIFSEAQRFAILQEQLKFMTVFPDLQWKRDEIARKGLELLRVEDPETWLPASVPPVTSDPITENFMAVTAGAPIKVSPEQDHIAHLQGHLAFILDPMLGAGPAIPGPQLAPILAHCQEHLMQTYLGVVKTAAAVRAAQTGEATEMTMAEAAVGSMQILNQQLGQAVVQQLTQAAEIVQQKMPQPQVDPAVQKTFEAAMAEIERKKAADVEGLKLKQAEMNGETQFQQMQQQVDARAAESANQLKLVIAQIQETGRQQVEELRQQVEMMKNDRDNEQRQMTELLKNRDDNQTSILIEQMKQAMGEMMPEAPVGQPQDDGMLREMQRMLSEIEKAKTGDALTATMEGLRAMMEQLGRPKMIMMDEAGRPVGIQ
jgi:hypothetical protein